MIDIAYGSGARRQELPRKQISCNITYTIAVRTDPSLFANLQGHWCFRIRSRGYERSFQEGKGWFGLLRDVLYLDHISALT